MEAASQAPWAKAVAVAINAAAAQIETLDDMIDSPV
jgi:hypothetical protein